MQLAVADHINIFLDMGVPDWRLDKLPDLFKQLLLQKEILRSGLSQIEINELERLLPTIHDLCKKLSTYSIKETIVQPDFHDNNTLINDISKNMTMIAQSSKLSFDAEMKTVAKKVRLSISQ